MVDPGDRKFITRDEDCRESEECTMNQLFKQIRFFGSKMEQHMTNEGAQYQELNEKIDMITSQIALQSAQIREQSETVKSMMVLFKAFPEIEDGVPDIHGHRRFHVGLITDEEEASERWKRIKNDLIQKLVTAIITGAVILIGWGFISWLQATTNIVIK